MSTTDDAFRFILCSSADGKLPPERKVAVRSHVMRNHLRKHPRSKKKSSKPISHQIAAASLATCAAPRSNPDLSAVVTHESARNAEAALGDALMNYSHLPASISALPLFRMQIRDAAGRLFDCRGNPGGLVTVSLPTLVSTASVVHATSDALDALCLAYLAATYNDKRWLSQALLCYQKVLVQIRLIISRNGSTKVSGELAFAIYVMWLYESLTNTNLIHAGWIGHACALLASIQTKAARDGLPVNSIFYQILKENIYVGATFSLGVVRKQRVSLEYMSLLETIHIAADVPFLRAVHRVPEMLERLATNLLSDLHSEATDRAINEALALQTEIETEFRSWRNMGTGEEYCLTDIASTPKFLAVTGRLPATRFRQVYTFFDTEAALVLRLSSMALFALECGLLTALTSAAHPLSFPAAGDDFSRVRNDLQQRVAQQVDHHALVLCRTFPYLIEHLRGYGRFLCCAPIHHLKEHYLALGSHMTPAQQEMTEFCSHIQHTLHPGSAIERMLSS